MRVWGQGCFGISMVSWVYGIKVLGVSDGVLGLA